MNGGKKTKFGRRCGAILATAIACLTVAGCEDDGGGVPGPGARLEGPELALDGGAIGEGAASVDAGGEAAPPPVSCRPTAETYEERTNANSYRQRWGYTYDGQGVMAKAVEYDSNGFEHAVFDVNSPSAVRLSSKWGTALTKYTVPVFSNAVVHPALSKTDTTIPGGTPQIDHRVREFEYDAKNRLIAMRESVPSVPNALPTVWELTWDDDDVRTLHVYLVENGNPVPSPVYTVTGYDDKPAPRSATPYFLYLDARWTVLDVIVTLSRNNPLGYSLDGANPQSVTLAYQYNAHGYPIERKGTATSGTTHVATFAYDCK